jgi:hypothetical protein
LENVLYEIYRSYVVFWYHWPYDDYTGKPDYEPIVLVFQDDILAAIGIRPHQSYKRYHQWTTEKSRPIVIFETSWHAPYIPQLSMRNVIRPFFMTRFSSIKIENYEIKGSKPPGWYIKDGARISVYDFAEHILDNLKKT